jgi:hypothetical protein
VKNLPASMARATESIINLEDACWQIVGEIGAAFGLAQSNAWEPEYQSGSNTLPGAMQALAVSLDAITSITTAAADVMGSTGLTRASQPRTPEATQGYDTIFGKVPVDATQDITPTAPQAATTEAAAQKNGAGVSSPLRVQLDPPGDDGVHAYTQNESGEWAPVETAGVTHESTPINGHDSPGSVRVFHHAEEPQPAEPTADKPTGARGRERRSEPSTNGTGKKKKGR